MEEGSGGYEKKRQGKVKARESLVSLALKCWREAIKKTKGLVIKI